MPPRKNKGIAPVSWSAVGQSADREEKKTHKHKSEHPCCSPLEELAEEEEVAAEKREIPAPLQVKGVRPNLCSECGRSFLHRSDLANHQRVHSGDKPFACTECRCSFRQSSTLITHQRIHTGEAPSACGDCGKRFRISSNFVRHRRIHTGERPDSCPICTKRFTDRSTLTQHQHKHTGEKPYRCTDCGKSFSRSSHRKRHLHNRSHCAHHPLSPPPNDSGDEAKEVESKRWTLLALAAKLAMEIPNTCTECWQSFSQSSDLIKHMRIHLGEKPFCCSHCAKRFSVSSNHMRHQRIHTGKKPYTCDKHFMDKFTLTQHQRTHTGEKPYTCIYCSKSFSHSSHPKRHERTHNSGDSSQSFLPNALALPITDLLAPWFPTWGSHL